MFGGESFEKNNERQSFTLVMSEEVKIAALEKSVFEEILISFYEDRL